MCGIAGALVYSDRAGCVDRGALHRMSERLRPRGPDGHGEYFSANGRLGLLHRRLAIIDLSEAGAQPMRDSESGAQIVFNGEIYNYKTLREGLVARGHVFKSHSDTEVILKLYAEWGVAMLPMLRGMFAFALWDERREGLLLARDQFGIKPLYVADDGGTFRFASQAKALLAGGGIDTAIDPAGMVGFFLWGHVPEPFTMHRAIRSLPPGSSQWVDRDGAKTPIKYYDLARRIEEIEPFSTSLSAVDAQAILSESLRDSMRHHLVADVPVGLFLSGGVDSGLLLALMSETGNASPRTFTLGFEEFVGDPRDETGFAANLAKHYEAIHTERRFGSGDFRQNFAHLMDAMDLPSIDGVNTYFVCKAAAEAGLKVAISGVGGDELFAGYPDFTFVPRTVRLLAPFDGADALGVWTRRIIAPLVQNLSSPKYASLLEYGCRIDSAYFLSRALYMPWELDAMLDPALLAQGFEELDMFEALRDSTPRVPSPRVKLTSLFGAWYMRNQLLRDSDWASMAHSLELRVPLVDVELWETVLRLVLSGNPVGKRELALSPKLQLPHDVVMRPKMGFHIPVRDWLVEDEPAALGERGLRGWARIVSSEFSDDEVTTVSPVTPDLAVVTQ